MWYLERHFRFLFHSHWQGVDLSQINLASVFFFQLMVPLLSWLFQFGVIKQESSLLAAALFSVPDTSQPQRRLMLHWNMRGPCCFLLRAKQSFIIAAGTYETAVGILTVPHGCCWLYEKKPLKSEFYLQKEIHWSNPQEVLVLNHGPLTTPLACLLFAFVPCEVQQKCSSYKNRVWNLTWSTIRCSQLLDSYSLCIFYAVTPV